MTDKSALKESSLPDLYEQFTALIGHPKPEIIDQYWLKRFRLESFTGPSTIETEQEPENVTYETVYSF